MRKKILQRVGIFLSITLLFTGCGINNSNNTFNSNTNNNQIINNNNVANNATIKEELKLIQSELNRMDQTVVENQEKLDKYKNTNSQINNQQLNIDNTTENQIVTKEFYVIENEINNIKTIVKNINTKLETYITNDNNNNTVVNSGLTTIIKETEAALNKLETYSKTNTDKAQTITNNITDLKRMVTEVHTELKESYNKTDSLINTLKYENNTQYTETIKELEIVKKELSTLVNITINDLNETIEKINEQLYDKIEETNERLNETIEDTNKQINNKIEKTNKDTLSKIEDSIFDFGDKLDEQNEELNLKIEENVENLTEQLEDVHDEIINAQDDLSDLLETMDTINDLDNQLKHNEVISRFDDLKTRINKINTNINTTLEDIRNLIIELQEQAEEQYNELLNELNSAELSLKATTETNSENILNSLNNASTTYNTITNQFKDKVTEGFENTNTKLDSVNQTMINKTNNMSNIVDKNFGEINEDMDSQLTGINNTFNGSLINFVTKSDEKIAINFENVFANTTDSFNKINKNISEDLTLKLDLTNGQISAMNDVVSDNLSDSLEEITKESYESNNTNDDIIQTLIETEKLLDNNYQSVTLGKESLSQALQSKGEIVAPDATFKEISDAIKRIKLTMLPENIDPVSLIYTYHHHGVNSNVENDSTTKTGGIYPDSHRFSTNQLSSKNGCFTKPIYHSHSGNDSSYGGCYCGDSYDVQVGCGYAATGTYKESDYHIGSSWYEIYCPEHGQSISSGSWVTCDHSKTETRYRLSCGKTAGVSIDYWAVGCGLQDGQIIRADIVYAEAD